MSEFDVEYRKLCWRSRRGMLELDRLLIPFVQEKYLQLTKEDQPLYVQLLACEDIDLLDWLVYHIKPQDPHIARIVGIILQYV